MYLQARWTWEGSKLLRHFFQYLFIILSVYTGMTRVSDYKHHWSDVMAGLFLGMFVAVLTVRIHTNSNHCTEILTDFCGKLLISSDSPFVVVFRRHGYDQM